MSSFSTVCPNCKKQPVIEAEEGWNEYDCPLCSKKATMLVAKVRAKRSRGNKKGGTRDYSIRLIYNGQEDFLEFTSDYSEFEMRSGDWVAFGYDRKKRLRILENNTLGRYKDLSPDNSLGCIIALVVIVALVGLFLVFGGNR